MTVTDIALYPVAQDQYARFLAVTNDDYIAQRARNFGTTLERERAVVERQVAQLLPDGVATAGHLIWTIRRGDREVGYLWAFVASEDEVRSAYIYNLYLHEAYRGQGIGGQALALLEQEVRPLGVTQISLNVFADNAPALQLYHKVGYQITNSWMMKRLEPEPS